MGNQIKNQQWSPQGRYLALVIVFILVGWFIFYIRELLGPLIIAALLAYVLYPAVNFLHLRARIQRRAAVVVVYFSFLVILVAIPASLAPLIFRQADVLGEQLHDLQVVIQDIVAEADNLGISLPGGDIPIDVENILGTLLDPQELFGVLQTTTENIIWIVVIFITTYYFMLDWAKMKSWIFRLVPESFQEDATILAGELRDIWRMYLRGQLLAMSIIGLLSGIGAAAIGLPGVFVFGLVAAILGVMPSIGSSVMVGIAFIVALFSGSSYLPLTNFWFAVVTGLLFASIHTLENYWLRPRILGRGLHLHPALVLLGVVGALTLAGVVMALIIVPIISTVEVLGKYLLRRIAGVDPIPPDAVPEPGD
ncbi:MAG: AI-2E family transporter [Chloroflexi bacterium]|nr:AI-2E family transporter [Chloroflexota bacterium]